MKQIRCSCFVVAWALTLMLGSWGPLAVAAPLPPSETLLGDHRKEAMGGFSHRWLAYVIEPQKDAKNKSWFVELNGTRLGPYSGLSQRFVLSPDGEHIAFTAEKAGKWVVVVDGHEKWTHKGLGWAEYGWTTDLEGRGFCMQCNAAIMAFSPNGDQLAYPVQAAGSKWAIAVNGKVGQVFEDLSINFQFVDDKVIYRAKGPKGWIYVHGDSAIGPYEEVWGATYSQDGKHFAFAAKKAGRTLFIVDGVEQDPPGDIVDYEMGAKGELVYAIKSGSRVKVHFDGRTLPGEYDEARFFTFSPDGKRIAFWASQGQKWTLVTDSKTYPGFDGYFYHQIMGGDTYAIMWSPDARNVAYFARDGDKNILVLNGKKLDKSVTPHGDSQAFVECLLKRAELKCDPTSVGLANGELAYAQTSGKGAFMVIGTRKEGPYAGIESPLLSSDDGKHYAYVVKTDMGQQVVLDGKLMRQVYQAVHRLRFLGDQGLAHLGQRDDKVFSAFYPYP